MGWELPEEILKLKRRKEPIGTLLEGGRIIRLRKGGFLSTLLENSDKRSSPC